MTTDERDYLDWYNRQQARAHDPAALVQAARFQYPQQPWLAEALKACTTTCERTERYTYFVPAALRMGRSFLGSVMLTMPEGEVVLDVYNDPRENGQRMVGGVEYLYRVLGSVAR